jgi:hypothetical protein
MPDTFIEMTFDEWEATYKPIVNHIDKNASFDDGEGGIMFETYGEEVEFVKAQDPACIWTYGDGDNGGSYVWNGWHFVNRLGYFITSIPCPPDTTIQIKVSEYWWACDGCGFEVEDGDETYRDKFGEFDNEFCPNCGTPEQLAEAEALYLTEHPNNETIE